MPEVEDLRRIAESLNRHGARYVLIGGFAMQCHGFARPTQDIDLLVAPDPDNVRKVTEALGILADGAAREVEPDDLARYSVVRVADEVVVDLLGSACGVSFDEVAKNAEVFDILGVPVPVARARDLWRLKQTIRPKDAMDREFLERLIGESAR